MPALGSRGDTASLCLDSLGSGDRRCLTWRSTQCFLSANLWTQRQLTPHLQDVQKHQRPMEDHFTTTQLCFCPVSASDDFSLEHPTLSAGLIRSADTQTTSVQFVSHRIGPRALLPVMLRAAGQGPPEVGHL